MNKTLLLFLMLFISSNIFGQVNTIQGTIHVFDSIPLIGARVKVMSTKQEILTDSLGGFSVKCERGDKLKVTARGFYTQNIKLKNKISKLDVNLVLKPGGKNREYATGYAHISDREKLISIANLNSDDIDFAQYTNMYDLIRGRFSNVQILGDQIVVRGTSSLTGSNSALIVIDGTITGTNALNSLSPVNVKSVNLLKGGAASIYGARGANGVLVIETKTADKNE